MAPSPTGFVHLGSARTALYNQLFARKLGGAFVLRLEDTDVQRNREEFEAGVYEGFHWLGLRWDEGPDLGGPFGPYRQSQRLDLYRERAAALIESGHAYRCYCTREELQAEREDAEREKRPYRYSRRCRDLVEPPAGRTEFTVRFRTPLQGEVAWDDAIRGRISFDAADLDDFIILRADGSPLYNFCVAVDDATMEITHVFRGEEHVSNTPRQLLVLDALGARRPTYVHLPVIIGKDRAKLSKRKHPEARLSLFQEQGYLPEAMVNYLALLGWNPGTERELFTLAELEQVFDLARVQRSPAMFDWQRLDWLNGQYIRALPLEELAARLEPFLPRLHRSLLPIAAAGLQERLNRLDEATAMLEFVWKPDFEPSPNPDLAEALRDAATTLEGLPEWTPEAIEAALEERLQSLGLGKGKFFGAIRQAVTGQKVAPPIHYALALLPREIAVGRLRQAAG